MLKSWKLVSPAMTTHGGFTWPASGPVVADPGGREFTRGDPCPQFPDDGLCLAKTVRGAQSGGLALGTAVGLDVEYDDADALGEDSNKLRVSRCVVTGVFSPLERLREGRWCEFGSLSGAHLSGAYLSGAKLYGADLSGADLSGADLSGADLSGANLCGANLCGAVLLQANLVGAHLFGADLSGANLYEAVLRGADLRWAVLREADLRWAVLRGADLREAVLVRADLYEANLRGADLRGANLYGAIGVEYA